MCNFKKKIIREAKDRIKYNLYNINFIKLFKNGAIQIHMGLLLIHKINKSVDFNNLSGPEYNFVVIRVYIPTAIYNC